MTKPAGAPSQVAPSQVAPSQVAPSQVVQIRPVLGMPEIGVGADLGQLIVAALAATGDGVRDGDIVVVTSKIVSKAQGLTASADGRAELVLRESTRVVSERATATGVTRIVTAKAGPVMAGAGIDGSNTGGHELLLLPHDPDACARDVRAQLMAAGAPGRVGVVLSDTAGRPWRSGQIDLALGLAGVLAVEDLRGAVDADGRDLAVTMRCVADEIAAAADLVKGKTSGVPVAVVRGLHHLVAQQDTSGAPPESARSLVRAGPEDWFSLGRAEAVRDALGVAPGSPESESIGIESVLPETLSARVERAIQVALHGCNGVEAAHRAGDARVVRLRASREVELGRAWARLEVALAGERLRPTATHTDDMVTIQVDPITTG